MVVKHCIAMLVRMTSYYTLIELSEEEDLAISLMAAVNQHDRGWGSRQKMRGPSLFITDENRKIFSLVTQDQARWIPVLELCPSV